MPGAAGRASSPRPRTRPAVPRSRPGRRWPGSRSSESPHLVVVLTSTTTQPIAMSGVGALFILGVADAAARAELEALMASPKFHSTFVDGLLQQGEEKGLEKGLLTSCCQVANEPGCQKQYCAQGNSRGQSRVR